VVVVIVTNSRDRARVAGWSLLVTAMGLTVRYEPAATTSSARALYNRGFGRYVKSLDAPERVCIVDVGETAGARFLVYHDDEEPTSAHGSLRPAEACRCCAPLPR
jgi:hypothetical protein